MSKRSRAMRLAHTRSQDYWLQLFLDVRGYQIKTLSPDDILEIKSHRFHDGIVNNELFTLAFLAGLNYHEVISASPKEVCEIIESYERVYD